MKTPLTGNEIVLFVIALLIMLYSTLAGGIR